jgi:hypothetical protein
MTKQEIKLKISQETYYIRRMLESCKTLEQVKNANRLACSLVDKWFWYKRHFGLSDSFDIDKLIVAAADDMTSFYNEAKDLISKRQTKHSVIPTGYWD